MQISEDLVKQITEAVIAQMQNGNAASAAAAPSAAVPPMAGRDRINEKKTSYAGYPKAKQGTDPKEVVIGVGAAFQREIKRTINGIPLEDVLKNVKAGIEEEGMVPRVVKILQTYALWLWRLRSSPVRASVSGFSPRARRLFTRRICIRCQTWSCFPRRLL